ncbi:MAG: hypothetical protein F6K08_35850 [Okeania sp. SIO1H6]|nr:hypothetical protein [Okeania sp. SIO1H6]
MATRPYNLIMLNNNDARGFDITEVQLFFFFFIPYSLLPTPAQQNNFLPHAFWELL